MKETSIHVKHKQGGVTWKQIGDTWYPYYDKVKKKKKFIKAWRGSFGNGVSR